MPDDSNTNIPVSESASQPIPPEVTETVPEAPTSTAQIPANDPIAPVSEPLPQPPPPQPAPQAQVPPASVLAPVAFLARDLAAKARAVIQGRKRKKLDKILTLFVKKKSISNDEVEKLLHVSDATATRYLTQLVKEGKLKQEGKTGKAVVYTKM